MDYIWWQLFLFCSCYANAVLQCLMCTKPLMIHLLLRLHSKDCNTKPLTFCLLYCCLLLSASLCYFLLGCSKNWCLMCELEQYASTLRESGGPVSPSRILSNLRNIGCRLGGGSQEDAHEFLRCFNLHVIFSSSLI
jgi:ubiquitin carboxyl-terminal hydrolase 36/42